MFLYFCFSLETKHFSSCSLKGTNFLRYHKKYIGFVLLVQGKTYNNKTAGKSRIPDIYINTLQYNLDFIVPSRLRAVTLLLNYICAALQTKGYYKIKHLKEHRLR